MGFDIPIDDRSASGERFVVVCIEASRRQSSMLGALAILACLYMLFGNFLPGVFGHAGMSAELGAKNYDIPMHPGAVRYFKEIGAM